MMHIPEHQAAFLIKRSGFEDIGYPCPTELESVKPTHRRMWISVCAFDMSERNLQATAQRPELVPTLDFKDCLIRFDCNLDHKISFLQFFSKPTLLSESTFAPLVLSSRLQRETRMFTQRSEEIAEGAKRSKRIDS